MSGYNIDPRYTEEASQARLRHMRDQQLKREQVQIEREQLNIMRQNQQAGQMDRSMRYSQPVQQSRPMTAQEQQMLGYILVGIVALAAAPLVVLVKHLEHKRITTAWKVAAIVSTIGWVIVLVAYVAHHH